MVYYNDLPDELQRFFPVDKMSLPSEIRHYITDGWAAIASYQRDEIVKKCRDERDSLRRILVVVDTLTRFILSSPRSERISI